MWQQLGAGLIIYISLRHKLAGADNFIMKNENWGNVPHIYGSQHIVFKVESVASPNSLGLKVEHIYKSKQKECKAMVIKHPLEYWKWLVKKWCDWCIRELANIVGEGYGFFCTSPLP